MKSTDLFPGCIGDIEAVIGYRFRDRSLITQAFTRTSFCNEANQRGEKYQSNEVLEFIGDGVLSVSIITLLMRENAERYPHGIRTKLNEGDFSNIKSKLSDKTNLSRCISSLGLAKYLRLGEGDKKLGIEQEPSVMEDLFESIIGAVYLDCFMDIETVMRVVSRMLDVSQYAVKSAPIQSSKNALQEFCADKKRRLPPPVYKTLGEEGPDHKKIYERGVYVGDRLIASAKGKNLKLADSAAAELALNVLVNEEMSTKKPEVAPQPKAEPKAKAEIKPKAEPKAKTEVKPKAEPKAKAEVKPKAKPEAKKQDKAPKAVKPDQKTEVKKPEPKQKAVKPTEAPKKASTAKKQPAVSKTPSKESKANSTEKKAKTANNLTRPTVKAKKPTASGEVSAAAKLKTHATKSKVATPTFKDLGESKNGGTAVYRVECIYMGKSAIGAGASRPEAKENAANQILTSLSPKKPEANPTAKKKKNTKK